MKTRIAKLLVASVILSAGIGAAFAKEYPDTPPSHWAYPQIQSLSKDKVVVGYPSGIFRPDEAVTRAEFATMVVKALRKENMPLAASEIFYFPDLPDNHWAYNAVQRACVFDLIKGFPDGSFKPEDNITKTEAVAIIVSAINAGDMTAEAGKVILAAVYKDADTIPDWAIIPAAKSEELKMTAHIPVSYDQFEPNKKASRAEIAVNIYNMIEEVKLHPNGKLAPKKAEGVVIDAVVDGITATVPAGTLLPVTLLTSLNSQEDETGKVFAAEVRKNLVTKDNFLIFPEGTGFSGEVSALKPARYFIRNAKMVLDTKYVNTLRKQKAGLAGNIDTKHPKRKLIPAVWNFIVRGSKIKLQEGKEVYIKLNRPVVVDLATGTIVK